MSRPSPGRRGIWRGEFDTARDRLRTGAQAALEPPPAPTFALLHAELTGRLAAAADESLRLVDSIGVVATRTGARARATGGGRPRPLAMAQRDTATVDAA